MQLSNSGGSLSFPSHLPPDSVQIQGIDNHEGENQVQNVYNSKNNVENNEGFRYYLQKSFLKTGSLMAKSCAASAVIGFI